jgi:hypothetical protein
MNPRFVWAAVVVFGACDDEPWRDPMMEVAPSKITVAADDEGLGRVVVFNDGEDTPPIEVVLSSTSSDEAIVPSVQRFEFDPGRYTLAVGKEQVSTFPIRCLAVGSATLSVTATATDEKGAVPIGARNHRVEVTCVAELPDPGGVTTQTGSDPTPGGGVYEWVRITDTSPTNGYSIELGYVQNYDFSEDHFADEVADCELGAWGDPAYADCSAALGTNAGGGCGDWLDLGGAGGSVTVHMTAAVEPGDLLTPRHCGATVAVTAEIELCDGPGDDASCYAACPGWQPGTSCEVR